MITILNLNWNKIANAIATVWISVWSLAQLVCALINTLSVYNFNDGCIRTLTIKVKDISLGIKYLLFSLYISENVAHDMCWIFIVVITMFPSSEDMKKNVVTVCSKGVDHDMCWLCQIIMAKPAGGPKAPKQRGHWDKDEWDEAPDQFDTRH